MAEPSEAVRAVVVPVWAAQGDAMIEAVAAWEAHVAAGRIGGPARATRHAADDAANKGKGAGGGEGADA